MGMSRRNLPKTKRDRRGERQRLEIPRLIIRNVKYLPKLSLSRLHDNISATKKDTIGKKVTTISLRFKAFGVSY